MGGGGERGGGERDRERGRERESTQWRGQAACTHSGAETDPQALPAGPASHKTHVTAHTHTQVQCMHRTHLVGKPNTKPSAWSTVRGSMTGTSAFAGACIFSSTSAGSVSATCRRIDFMGRYMGAARRVHDAGGVIRAPAAAISAATHAAATRHTQAAHPAHCVHPPGTARPPRPPRCPRPA